MKTHSDKGDESKYLIDEVHEKFTRTLSIYITRNNKNNH